jgi:3-hydroxyisobutyrate dehydrogenase-like beta-hydroxyacid dehydrogenase
MRVGFAGPGPMGRPVCANLAWAGYVVTAGDVRGELDSMVAGWGCGGAAHLMRRRPGAEVLITILSDSQELHDVMLLPRSARTSLFGVVISAPRCG